jgi:hypothetical protein
LGDVQEELMSARPVGAFVLLLSVALTPIVDAQKGGRPKPVDIAATAEFRCTGPTAETRVPAGTPCGPFAEFGVPDAITGDASGPYVGIGTDWTTGTGAFMRSDGQLTIFIRPAGRMVFLNFEEVVKDPAAGARKTFDFADLNEVEITTTIYDPDTKIITSAALMPINQPWRTRLKVSWQDPYRVFYSIRFNANAFPGSSDAWLTRTSDTSWVLSATERDIARLVSPASGPKRDVDEGWYRMPFEIEFTIP